MHTGLSLAALPTVPEQVLPQEENRQIKLIIGVAALAEAVSFVLAEKVPDRRVVFPDALDDLFGFADRNGGVVGALHHEERRGDAMRLGQRRDVLEKSAHGGVALIAVFDAPQVAPPFRGFFEKA